MITIYERFDNVAAATIYVEQYLQHYHPEGYGTAAFIEPEREGTQITGFLVKITRSESCE